MSNDKYTVTVKEASERLGVSKRTIYRKLNNNELEGVKKRTKHGDKWFISENEFSDQAEIINEIVEVERQIGIEDLKQAFKEIVKEQNKELNEQVESLENEVKKLAEERKKEKQELIKVLEDRDKKVMQLIREKQKQEEGKSFLGWFKKIFNK